MKSFLTLLVTLTLSVSALAFTDGEYTCGSKSDKFQYTYKITTLAINGIALPHLDITKAYSPDNAQDKAYTIKGVATQFTNDEGQEILVLGNITLELTSGRPSCIK